MLEVNNLFHSYTNDDNYAVHDISFAIGEGEMFGFLGPSGAGKSTTQNILTGLIPRQKGQIVINGRDNSVYTKELYNMIGVSFEQPNVYRRLSGLENLEFFRRLYEVETTDPMELLDMVGLKGDAHKKAGEYSKGMLQRLVFARSLINNPRIMFLDEPLAGLDPGTARRIKDVIKGRQADGVTIFLTTHNMFVADEMCSRVAFINNGKIVALDAPRDLKLKYGQHLLKVEYRDENRLQREQIDMQTENGKQRFKNIMDDFEIETVHSQEATLEEIFIKLTGRGLGDE